MGKTQILVPFYGKGKFTRFRNRFFKKTPDTYNFLNNCYKILKKDETCKDKAQKDVAILNLENWFKQNTVVNKCVVTKTTTVHRRMAQTRSISKFSKLKLEPRRRSPVMIRLLEEIVRANQKHNELN